MPTSTTRELTPARPFRRPLSLGFAAVALVASLGACRTEPRPTPEPPRERAAAPVPADARGDFESLVAHGLAASGAHAPTEELERAHALLSRALAERHLTAAREAVREARFSEALRAFDRALVAAPDDERARIERAETFVLLGDRRRAEGAGGIHVQGAYEDARRQYEDTGRSARALLGAAHAAWLTNEAQDAHRLAEEGYARHVAALRTDANEDDQFFRLGPLDREAPPFASPERIRAQAALLAHSAAVQARESEASRRRIADVARVALDGWLGHEPAEPAAWNAAIDFALWRFEPEEALTTLRAALDTLPREPSLIARVTDIATRARGDVGAANVIAEWADAPGAATALREAAARALLVAGLAELPRPGPEPVAYPEAKRRFDDAARRFGALSDADGVDARAARGWRALAILGRGWVEYAELDLDAAEQTFRSVADIEEGALHWDWTDRGLRSPLVGLQLLAPHLRERGELDRAAALLEWCHGRHPTDALLASNAALFLRDAATERARDARDICAGLGNRPERLPYRRTVTEIRSRAGLAADGSEDHSARAYETARAWLGQGGEEIERSFETYLAALDAAPDDPWILRDAALMLVYYLHRDFDRAVRWLERAAEIAERMAEDEDRETASSGSVTEVFGDCHENLGVYHSNHTGDLEAAERHLRRAIEIGPPRIPRGWVRRALEAHDGGEPDALRNVRFDEVHLFRPCEENSR